MAVLLNYNEVMDETRINTDPTMKNMELARAVLSRLLNKDTQIYQEAEHLSADTKKIYFNLENESHLSIINSWGYDDDLNGVSIGNFQVKVNKGGDEYDYVNLCSFCYLLFSETKNYKSLHDIELDILYHKDYYDPKEKNPLVPIRKALVNRIIKMRVSVE
jgi:hypothetical protein